MLILLLRRLLANICEMAINRHDGGSCGMSATIRRAMILFTGALWRLDSAHDGEEVDEQLREYLKSKQSM